MKTTISDPQLEEELQELYILSKHRMSDINFVEDEIRFLRDVIDKYLRPKLKVDELSQIDSFNQSLNQIESNVSSLKNIIADFLKFIEPMIDKPENGIGTDLLEKFGALEIEMQELFESVKQVKKLLFSFAETVMKTELTTFLDQN